MSKKLLIAGIIIVVLVVLPIFGSIFISQGIQKDSVGNFPKDPSQWKQYVFEKGEPWAQANHEMIYYGYKLPTDREIQKLKNSVDLTRHYPETIKADFAPGVVPNTNELLYFSDELADLGVNTYWVIGEYRIENNKISQFMPLFNSVGFPGVLSQEDAKKVLAWRILLAKKAGFATILIPDLPSASNVGRENFDIVKLKPEFEKLALDLAKLAEQYQVEYLSPVNEYEHMLFSNSYTIDEVAQLEKEFYDEIIPQIRQIYHGKIVIKTGDIGGWEKFPKLSMKGADLFGVGNAYAMGAGEIFKDETAKALYSDQVSERDNVPWFESEFLIYRPTDQQNFMGRVESTYPMENAYQEGTTAFERTAKRAVGFTFMSLTAVGRTRQTPSEDVLKNFFSRWKPTPKVVSNINPQDYVSADMSISLWDRILNIPQFYMMFGNRLIGRGGPQKETSPGQNTPGGCKTKAECDAYCSKPENSSSCKRFGGNGPSERQQGGPQDKQNQNFQR